MVLTDRQRADLHAGIHEYLLAQSGDVFAAAAKAMFDADPEACRRNLESSNDGQEDNDNVKSTSPSRKILSRYRAIPLIEKKWTAVPRLQKKVLELERALSAATASNTIRDPSPFSLDTGPASTLSKRRRMLPRPPSSFELTGHSSSITCVAIHPIFTLCASTSDDGTIKLWDYEAGQYVRTLRGHTQPVTFCAFDYPYGSLLVSCANDLCIKLWSMRNDISTNVQEGQCLRTLRGHDHTISCVVFVPIVPTVDSGSGGGVAGGGGGMIGGTGSNKSGEKLAATHLLSASRDHTIKLWEVESGFCIHTFLGHTDWVRTVAVKNFLPVSIGGIAGATIIASAGNDTTVLLWSLDLQDESQRKQIGELRGHEHVIESVAFCLDNGKGPAATMTKTGAAASVASKLGQSAATSVLSSPGSTKASNINSVSNDPDQLLVSGGRDRSVRLWDIHALTCLATFAAHDNWVRSVILHPSGLYILSCGDDRTIRVFDIKANRCLRTIENAHKHFVTSIAMHPTLPIMVSGGVDHSVLGWSLD